MDKARVLVIDDEVAIRLGIRRFLEVRGYEVAECGTAGEAEVQLRALAPDLVILDLRLPDASGIDLIRRIKELAPLAAILMLTAFGSIELAVSAVKEGADQFLVKPIDLASLEVMLERLLEHRRTRVRELASRSRRRREADSPLDGISPAIRRFAEEVRRIQSSDSPVLIEGATGTGKGVLARWLHKNGPRSREQLVDLNCAGLPRDLVESELFGHEKGAFTGAASLKLGLLEVAHRGTLFLDEIGDLDLVVQPKLLTALEEKRFRRLGDVRDRHSDFRLIAATHAELPRLCQEGRFRLDLYFRISTIPLRVPSLAERREDIPMLASRLLERSANELGRPELHLSNEAVGVLTEYAWPGNIRELRNVLERAVLLASEAEIRPDDLRFAALLPSPVRAIGGPSVPASIAAASASGSAAVGSLAQLERSGIEQALRAEQGHVGRAATRLGIPRSTLYKKLKSFGIPARH